MIETVNGIPFKLGEKTLSFCGKFWVCPVEIEFDGRTIHFAMDGVLLDLPTARHHQFIKIVQLLEQHKESQA